MTTTLYTHPEYKARESSWIIARDLYEGSHETLVSKYLWYHAIEQATKDLVATRLRAGREQRTRYLNLSEILISVWQSLFFREPPRPDDKLKKLLDAHDGEQNIDGAGTSLTSFIKNKVLVSRLNYGKVCIICDAFPIQPRNFEDQIRNKVRPFMDLIWPLDNTDWSAEYSDPSRIGHFNFFRYQYFGVMPRMKPSEEPKIRKFSNSLVLDGGKVSIVQHYVDVDENFNVVKEHWDTETKSESWQGEKTIPTDLTKVPVSVIDGESWLRDANEESLRFFNIRSTKDNILHQQGYQDKYIIGVSPTDTERIQAFNEYSYKMLPADGNAIVLEPVDPSGYERAESEALANVFKAGLNKLRIVPLDSKETQSSESQDKENEYTYSLVESELEEMEQITNDAFQNYARFMGQEDFDGKVAFNKSVTPERFQQFIEAYGAFRDTLGKIEGFDKATARKVIKKLRFDKKDEEDLLKKVESLKTEPPDLKLIRGGSAQRDPVADVLNGR